MSVTAFIGAGAVLDLGGPSTNVLTAAIKLRQQWDGVPMSNIRIPSIQQIADALDRYYAPATANFEDIFHAIESVISFLTGLRARTARSFKPAIGAFAAPTTSANYTHATLIEACDDVIDEVANHIVAYVSGFQPHAGHQWFSRFWQEATHRCPWDIAILNYDDCIEQSLGTGAWEDGFAQLDPGVSRFDPVRIANSAITRILHVHGSVFYGYPRFADPNRFIFEDQHEDLYRFVSCADARQTWFNRSRNQTQSGERATAGPIITGQRKTDKLLGVPYSTYQAVLHDAMLNNPRLLIAGYSFGDLHFNSLLSRMTRIHGNNRRIVIVDYVPVNMRPPNWIPDPTLRRWPALGAYRPIAQLSQERLPLDGGYVNPWISSDQRCRIYLEGFQEAVENHETEIIDFLTT